MGGCDPVQETAHSSAGQGWLPKLQTPLPATRDSLGSAPSSSLPQEIQRPGTPASASSSSIHPRLLAIKARIQERLQQSRAAGSTSNTSTLVGESSQGSDAGSVNSFQSVQAPPKYRNEIWFRK